MNLLNELTNNTGLVRLSDAQKAVMVIAYAATTPQLAAELIRGNQYVLQAKAYLVSASLLREQGDTIVITNNGYDVLTQHGLIDETGKVTEEGSKLATKFKTDYDNIQEHKIPYRIIKSLQ